MPKFATVSLAVVEEIGNKKRLSYFIYID